MVYQEDVSGTTNDFGVLNISVGGSPTVGNLNLLNWSTNSFFVQILFNSNAVGARTQLLSVPFALFANKADTAVYAHALSEKTPVAIYGLSANTTPLNANASIVNYDIKRVDNYNAVTTGSSQWKFTAPVDGLYSVKARAVTSFGAGNVSDRFRLYIYKNGGSVCGLDDRWAYMTHSHRKDVHGSCDIYLEAGDNVNVRVIVDGGTSYTIDFGDVYIVKIADL